VVRFGNAKVVELLRVRNYAMGQTAPAAVCTESELRIGPGAIHRKQHLSYMVLIDGAGDIVHESPLTDVTVEIADEDRNRRRSTQLVGLAAAIAAAMGAIGFLESGLGDFADRRGTTPPQPTVTVTVTQPPTR
jgi:hypothetical protein